MKKILIVDDDEQLRKLLMLTLSYADYQLHFAMNGEEAMRMAIKLKPDVLILDVMMPGRLNGFEVCRRLKSTKNSRDIYIVLLTGLTEQYDKEMGAETGANAYVVKPFSPLRLVELIESKLNPFEE